MQATDIEQFHRDGYVVVPFFTQEEVSEMRRDLHNALAGLGLDHDTLLSKGIPSDYSQRVRQLKDVYHLKTKDQAQLRLQPLANSLMTATYARGAAAASPYTHPLGASTGTLPFVDHVAYRLPDHILAEGGLQLHIDRNPHHPFDGDYFRPIQSWIALTDHYGKESGGLQVVPGFHHEYNTYFKNIISNREAAESGGFFRMHSKSYASVRKRLVAVNVPAGSVVFWDHHLPHATCDKLTSYDTREIFLFSYMPDVSLNRKYYDETKLHRLQSI